MNKVETRVVVTVLLAVLLVGCGDKTTNMSQESDDIRIYEHEFIEESSQDETIEKDENTQLEETENETGEYITFLPQSDSNAKVISPQLAMISYDLLNNVILHQNDDTWSTGYTNLQMSKFNEIVKECERYADYFDLSFVAVMNDDDTFYVTFRKDYCVKRGDTLSKIASKYGVTVEYIINLNSDVISNPNELEAGTLLRLY